MKIIRLQASNLLRLVAVDISPTGDLVIVGGRNGAGKSSVLNSIAMALGGKAMCPQEPIRAGESEAKIELDLGDLKVTRKFSRAVVKPSEEEADNGIVKIFGETTSTLVVTNKDGAHYPSPQAMLDKLLGRLTFDPLAFSRDDPKRQDETLRRVVGLDVTAIEQRRKAAFDQRAMLKKTLAIKEAQLAALPTHDGVPDKEVPLAEVAAKMEEAEKLRKLADDARREVDRAKDLVTARNDQRNKVATQLDEARRRVAELESELSARAAGCEEAARVLDAATITYDSAVSVVPDVAALRAKLAEVEQTNVKVRANTARNAAQGEVTVLHGEVAVQHKAIADADEAKLAALKAVTFPVPGLGLSDDGVTLNGLPFSQASTAEQLRVSVAIGLALNPTLKVLLIRSGNLLDDDSLKMVAAQAEEAGAQVWCEYVTANPEGVSVMIEDGRVAG